MKTGFPNVETEKTLVVRPPVSMRSEMVSPVTNHKGGKQLSIFLNAYSYDITHSIREVTFSAHAGKQQ